MLVTAEALGIIASRQAPKSDDMDAEISKIMCMGNARKILSSLPQARQQKAGNATALQMLDRWESLARSTLDGQ